MSKRKLEPSTEGRDFSIRSYIKDLRLRRVFSLGSDSKAIESTENGAPDTGSCEAGCGKDPITDVEIKEVSRDCEKGEKGKISDSIKELDKDLTSPGGTNKTGYQPKGILKKPIQNGSGWDREDTIQRTPPENVITADTGELNNCQNTLTKSRARIAPLSRQKLVQVPGSFSYRRLLPYLTEMDKDEVQVSSNEEKSSAPNVHSPNSILSEHLDFAEIPVSKTSNLEKSELSTAPVLVSTDESCEIPKSENTQLNSTYCTFETQPPWDDSIQAMEKICRPHWFPSFSSDQRTLTIEELASGNVLMKGETGISSNIGEMFTSGCKGICTCLDCVLFRIHAERSFEFSKKQLNEADEIIRGLVTEICSLRGILEKSIGNRCSDSSQVYKFQNELIKVVCERASLAEKLAIMRTKQMFTDLNAHCKQQEARVEFSDCIDQRTIRSSIEISPRGL